VNYFGLIVLFAVLIAANEYMARRGLAKIAASRDETDRERQEIIKHSWLFVAVDTE